MYKYLIGGTMKSKIYIDERVVNKDRKFGEAKHYYPCRIVGIHGTELDAAFTRNVLEEAIERGNKNKEDFVDNDDSFVYKLIKLFL